VQKFAALRATLDTKMLLGTAAPTSAPGKIIAAERHGSVAV